ncbi:amidohydrolase family protein [Rhizobium ruizarguesonis]|uniref:amidohydrolase family protein n=1 Tax=Rhizobium ruizarguesonis TaxID=2081791 RepID=UPI0010321C11|nr:amidohydrolase family protein [Rhizobium ruizarguesonis]TBA52711.1 amidohydrolase [Rhizobium ruizarguesonis]
MQANKRAYRGRIVQMDATFTVLRDGIVWIEANRIVAVADAIANAPSGFEHIQPIMTGGTIFPGLIELHNHLAYDVLRLWEVPKQYGNRGQWQGTPEYQALVSGPMKVLGKAPGIAPAIARYTEAKCLLGGTTTSQGLTLFSNSGIKRKYRGLIRNAEESLDSNLSDAMARIPDYEAKDKETFLRYLKNYKCFLLHLSEGIDESARNHFLSLEIEPDTWAIAPSLTGIHCTALQPEDFERLAQNGAGMVWSPLSNLMLYGKTAGIKAARSAGVRIGLGSDWSPTGSKNLLHEMKIAWRYSELEGGVFSQREVVAMATISAAGLLRWDRYLGSIETGKYADLIVVRGNGGDPYDSLLNADETGIDLVVVDGIPRCARPDLAAGFTTSSEPFEFTGEKRLINFDDAAADQAVAGLSLSAAEGALQHAMSNLGTLADAINRMKPFAQGPADLAEQKEEWTLELDQDEPYDFNLRTRFDTAEPTSATLRLSEDMVPMALPLTSLKPQKLDALTVAEDATYYQTLRAQRNISDVTKLALFPTL